jgi:hypothetical protein
MQVRATDDCCLGAKGGEAELQWAYDKAGILGCQLMSGLAICLVHEREEAVASRENSAFSDCGSLFRLLSGT